MQNYTLFNLLFIKFHSNITMADKSKCCFEETIVKNRGERKSVCDTCLGKSRR